jgi:hypothetical protein
MLISELHFLVTCFVEADLINPRSSSPSTNSGSQQSLGAGVIAGIVVSKIHMVSVRKESEVTNVADRWLLWLAFVFLASAIRPTSSKREDRVCLLLIVK